jgi:hypothetical protein
MEPIGLNLKNLPWIPLRVLEVNKYFEILKFKNLTGVKKDLK